MKLIEKKENLSIYMLNNGLKVVLYPIDYCSLFGCSLWIGQGSSYEKSGEEGYSHLLEHLTMNLENMYNPEYASAIHEVIHKGCIYNAFTNKENTVYHIEGTKDTYQEQLKLLQNIALSNHEFDESCFQKEKKVVIQEYYSTMSSFQQISERVSGAVWGHQGIGNPIVGKLKSLEMADKYEMMKFAKQSYCADNAALVITGEFPKEIIDCIERMFSAWDRGSKRSIVNYEKKDYKRNYYHSTELKNGVLGIGFKGPSYSSVERIRLQILNEILAGMFLDSRLYRKIRIGKGAAYNIGSFQNYYKDRGTFGYALVCDNQELSGCYRIVMEELQDVIQNGVEEEELQCAKNRLITKRYLEYHNVEKQNILLGSSIMNGTVLTASMEIDLIHNQNCDNIDKTAREYLSSNNMGIALISKDDLLLHRKNFIS